jgi:hypothetical protein
VRASARFATFAQAIISTSSVAPERIQASDRTSSVSVSRSGIGRAVNPSERACTYSSL